MRGNTLGLEIFLAFDQGFHGSNDAIHVVVLVNPFPHAARYIYHRAIAGHGKRYKYRSVYEDTSYWLPPYKLPIRGYALIASAWLILPR